MQQFIAKKEGFEELCLAKGKELIRVIKNKYETELQVKEAFLQEKVLKHKEGCKVSVDLSPTPEKKVIKGKRKIKLLGHWVEVDEC